VHGDEIKSFGGNTPAFGILRKCNQWSTGVIPEPFSDVYMGHFHTPMTLTMANGGQIYVTGSPESENVYAMWTLTPAVSPRPIWYGLTNERKIRILSLSDPDRTWRQT
jgi:DNA repair exonuclease SbcCD nuclease subunit